MPIEIDMPRLSDTMEEGTLIKWRVKVGDEVKSGDLLADVETDKATMELQSYDDGTVAELAVPEGKTVSVGKRILLLAQEGESLGEAVEAVGAGVAAGGTADPAVAVGAVDSAKMRVSPVARKIAQEHGLDLGGLVGSGPGGRIVKRDVLEAVGGERPAGPADVPVGFDQGPANVPATTAQTVPLSNRRKTIANRLIQSKATIPHFTVTVAVNMDPLMDLRSTLNKQLVSEGVKLSVNDFVVRASAMALVDHRFLNSSWADDGIRLHGAVNVGVAVALPQEKGGGLVVATIRDAHHKTVRQIGAETRRLAQKARAQGLTVEEMADGTFTVSNLGMFDVEHFEAIINPPQVAILAVGAAHPKPVVRAGQLGIGHEMSATLSADHRVVDGAMAAEFLGTIQQKLENPAGLLV